MGAIINGGTLKAAGDAAIQWYRSTDEAQKLIIRHSCIAGAIALIPLPVVGEIAIIVNQVAMYRGINRLAGVTFSQNVLKNIGKFLLSQVAGILGGAAAIFGIAAAVKFIPGLNFLAGVAEAPIAGVANYICGIAYFKMLGGYIVACGGSAFSDEETLRRMKEQSLSNDDIRNLKTEAEEKMKGVNYASFKSEAEAVAEEARRNEAEYK